MVHHIAMSRNDPHKLRIPPTLKVKINQAAVENHRSLNAETLARLEESFETNVVVINASSDQLMQMLLAVQADLAEMKQTIQNRKT